MHVILTHEQADFDAMASMLGAYLLDEAALPVSPRRMNRNVRSFLTLYGNELPFVDPRDLPNLPIESVTLVDTQSMVSLRGMTPGTRVHIIDHHPAREGLPAGWTFTRQEVGATTTLLVEVLHERDGLMTNIQATMLLLGIYEDTGSLTYTRTTPQDLRAAAYLLEQGASIDLVTEFLNHPLTQSQQELYDRLRVNSKYYHIHGHTIIVACDNAQEVEEELSSVVHKLRDLLDPDALFVLASTRGGVQIIARSTSDNIDVAAVLAHFGGGGHERAAAGLIRDRELGALRTELASILPDYVRPAITVAQIMSRDPQLLSPWILAEEAAQRMRRYGYEGFPVVQNDKLIGLLTRRAVDRALAHKLYHMTAASLMNAGEYTVQPDDPVEQLQRMMTDSGWGQIPVVDPENGKIIGIVTRTDLLKTLTSTSKLPSRQSLTERLAAALPEAHLKLLQAISHAAHEEHTALYIVGGFVRDLLLNRPSLDFDLVVEGEAIKLAQALSSHYGGRVTSHARFGTAKWHLPEPLTINGLTTTIPDLHSIDLVSARTEFYTHPTALPTVERGSIKLDLHRRDFTINTLALRLDGRHYGELHDYWGGVDDLQHGLVRVLHSLSFVDDPTRMLRAVRFEQRFGFQIEERTIQLLKEALSLLGRISGDRIRHELDNILVEKHAAQIIARLDELNLLINIHPALSWDEWLGMRFKDLPIEDPSPEWELPTDKHGEQLRKDLAYILWLARLPLDLAENVTTRLKLPTQLKNIVFSACQLWRELPNLPGAPASQAFEHLQSFPPLARFAIYLGTTEPALKEILYTYAFKWQKISPTIDGHTLQNMGLPPGPAYRYTLNTLRHAWLDGEIQSSEQEAALLRELLDQSKPPK